jgi:hypothetical protein
MRLLLALDGPASSSKRRSPLVEVALAPPVAGVREVSAGVAIFGAAISGAALVGGELVAGVASGAASIVCVPERPACALAVAVLSLLLVPPAAGRSLGGWGGLSRRHQVGPWIPVTPVDLVPTLAGGDTPRLVWGFVLLQKRTSVRYTGLRRGCDPLSEDASFLVSHYI